MRIAQAVCPDLLACAFECRKGIVVRDPVPPVLADRARRRVFAQVGHDAQDLSDEGVEPLRIQTADVFLLAGAGIANADVHDPPVGIAGPRDGIEDHLAQRVDGRGVLEPHQLSRRALESRVRRIAVPPLDHHHFAIDPPARGGRGNRSRRRVTRQVEAGDHAGPRPRRGGNSRILHVDRVEDAVARVVGIEEEVRQTGSEIALEREFHEQAGPSAGAVEVEIGRERLRLLVDDVERAVEVVHEESAAARLVPQEVDPGQLSPRVLPIELAGDRHRRVVFQFEGQPCCRLDRERVGDRKHQSRNDDRLQCQRRGSAVLHS